VDQASLRSSLGHALTKISSVITRFSFALSPGSQSFALTIGLPLIINMTIRVFITSKLNPMNRRLVPSPASPDLGALIGKNVPLFVGVSRERVSV
jgi:hypothetical protein